MRRILVLAAWLVIGGCGEGGQPSDDMPPAPKVSDPAREAPTEVERVAWMEGHYSVVILAHDALLQGDLERFRSQLAKVADQDLPPGSPQAWIPLEQSLQDAAAEGASAGDLPAAADALASVVLACGTCHTALGTGPIYPAPAPDDGISEIETAMLDHQWASERLWEGVTGPWDNAWQRGADALADTRVFGEQGEVQLAEDVRAREEALRALGREAKTTTALPDRAVLYGRLLATCADCHQAIGLELEEPRASIPTSTR